MSEPTFTISTSDLTPLFELITLGITTTGAAFMAWIAYRQAVLVKRVDELHKSTNSKMDMLLQLVAEASEAKGMLAGRLAEQRESAIREGRATKPRARRGR